MSVVLQLDNRTVDLGRGEVRVGGDVVPLTIRETSLLRYLHVHQGRVISRDELHREVWGHTVTLNTRAADFAIRRLRTKIEDDPAQPTHLRTQYGEGYVLMLSEQAPAWQEDDHFFGRGPELDHLHDLFEGGAQIVTILGAGGLGKTTLARRFAERRCSRAAVFCDLSGATDLPSTLQTLAAALRVPLRAGGDAVARMDSLVDAMGPILLILDNVEQILEPTRRLLDRCRRGAAWVLLTSRARLPTGAVLMLGPLPLDDGEELFLDRLAALRGRHGMTPALRAEARSLVSHLDGLPLAIELAAARGRLFTPAVLERRLSDRLSLLRDGDARSLRDTIDGSWDLLTPRQQRAFAQCGVFRGPFSAEAALAVVEVDGDALAVVEALCDHSMVQTWMDLDAPRLRLFESLRDYALEKLDALGARAATEARYRRWVLSQGAALVAALRRTERQEERSAIDGMAADLHHAFDLCLAQEPARAPELLGALHLLLGSSRATRDRVRAAGAALPATAPPAAAFEVAYWRVRLDLDDPDVDASAGLQALEAQVGALDDPAQEARVHLLRSMDHWTRADYPAAVTHLEAAEARFDALGDAAGVSRVACRLAVAATLLAQPPEAAEAAVRRARHAAPDNVRSQMFVHAILGMLRIHQGAPERALEHLEQAMVYAEQVADRRSVATAVINIGIRMARLGALQRGAELLERGIEMNLQLGLLQGAAEGQALLAKLLLFQGDAGAARAYLDPFLRLLERTALPPRIACDGVLLDGILHGCGAEPARARRAFRQAVDRAREMESPVREGVAWLGCLLLPDEDGIHAEARRHLEAASEAHPRLREGLEMVDGNRTFDEAPFSPWMMLHLLQGMRGR